MNKKVILVNKNDQPIGLAEKLKAHQDGKLHRAFCIFIFNVHYWIIFVSATLSVAFYMLTKHYGMQIIERQKKRAMVKIKN